MKITNFRLHKALGNDPPPPESEATPSFVGSEDNEHEGGEKGGEEPFHEERMGLEEGERMAEVVILEEDPDVSGHHLSASTLNEGGSLQNTNTPEIELSQVSQPVEGNTITMETNTESG